MSETAPATTARAALRQVVANQALRRVQGAFFVSLLGDYAYSTAVTVWAFQQGGATAVGIFVAVRFVAVPLAAPVGAVLADRVPRRSFMMASDLLRAGLVGLAAVAVAVDLPPVVYVLAVVAAAVGAPFRAAQAGLIPALVETPEQLTASNAVASNLENVVVFAGPALGALVVGTLDVEVALWFDVVTFLVSFALVAGVRVPAAPVRTAGEEHEADERFLTALTAGFRLLGRDRDLAGVASLAAAQGLVWGALNVFLVVVAVRELGTGAAGVGYLDAVLGVGTVVGGLVVLTRLGRGSLGRDMVLGVLGWSLPLLLLAALPSAATAFVVLAVVGALDPFVNLALDTVPQRLAPERLLSRVFAAVDTSLTAASAVGAFLAPLLLHAVGLRWSLTAFGAVVATCALAALPRMRRLDARLREPEGLPLLRSLPLFAPLAPAAQEALAHRAERVRVPAGTPVVREGEVSDRFYVIAAGSVVVTSAGRQLRTEHAGDFFGEIGLLRDVPRTATVTAVDDVDLLVLGRADFLAAVAAAPEARLVTEEVISRRLAV
jgi:MFS family permease